jgi:hypothetical protein
MTPKEKAIELYDKMYSINKDEFISIHASKNAALIAVDEILNSIVWHYFEGSAKAEDNWWREVKQEIEKL